MAYFDLIQEFDHESILFCSDKASGLRAFIGIHDRTLGPSLGGCRMKAYASEQEAFEDVLLLSRAMTFKNSLAGLDIGGGKTVVILDKPEDKTPQLLQALAERIDSLHGAYIGAGDIGSNAKDLAYMRKFTPWLNGLAKEDGGLGDSGTMTAYGVYMGIKATAKKQFGTDDLSGKTIAVQGVGKVGYHTMEHLLKEGAMITATDVYEPALKRVAETMPQVKLVSGEELLSMEADILSPNAVGGLVTAERAKTMKFKAIAGGANNILAQDSVGEILKERGILFAPDFAINSGGVITIAFEYFGKTYEEAEAHTSKVYETILKVYDLAESENTTPMAAARKLAMQRVLDARKQTANV